ncbi:uncharacterized protein F4822DRAFT_436029 [Hypoxylon trugodes]|uniref:uncharacterized protein n=1 Tax=Hypoxylon trugodes TaxID=326681 RepID=UPI002197A2CF|nr:uncharacterized protein F4822DRAFT_436029 [Hypoxylon trugodes]KAI1391809.1 hypothetical protein F4822DRAFT_436029 [Hypoxylon trugodes]
MIDESLRYWAPGGSIMPGGPSTWHIVDWDQRRTIAVTMDEEQEDESISIEHSKKYINNLGPDVYAIHLSPDGSLVSTSTDPKDDATFSMYYPPFEKVRWPIKTSGVLRSELLELKRLGANVDLVSYTPKSKKGSPPASPKKVVFKYYFHSQFTYGFWNEMNLWMRLSGDRNIVPFDNIVLDEIKRGVVRFTSTFIPGDTVQTNMSRGFKLEWLRQLTRDIAARNLLVHPKTDNLLLFDFNFSGRLGEFDGMKAENDIKGVVFTLYEIITCDYKPREVPPQEQDPEVLQRLDEWVKHPDVTLDHPVSEYRSVLNEWAKKRQERKQIARFDEASDPISRPKIPDPPPTEANSVGSSQMERVWTNSRYGRGTDPKVIDWERPLWVKLEPESRVFANGEVKIASDLQLDEQQLSECIGHP